MTVQSGSRNRFMADEDIFSAITIFIVNDSFTRKLQPSDTPRYCISYTQFSLQVHPWRKIMKLLMVVLLTAVAATGVGCGYSSHATTPPAPGTKPTIAQLTPPSTAAGSSDFTLTVQGTNFSSAAVVKFNGTAMATTFDSATEVKAT